MLLYFIICRPFKKPWNNILNIFNEVIIFLCFGTVLLINLYSVSTDVMNILGYSLLALIAVGFILCWIVMGITAVKAFQKKAKNKKKKEVKSNDTQNKIKDEVNPITSEKESLRIEERRMRNNSKMPNKE